MLTHEWLENSSITNEHCNTIYDELLFQIFIMIDNY
jgi:hypothetical protein